jgi:hypothetical protein
MATGLNEGVREHLGLVLFQIQIAERWLEAAQKLREHEARSPEFEFLAYFAAFNSMYWLWGEVTNQQAFTEDERRSVDAVLTQDDLPESLRKRMTDGMRGRGSEQKLIKGLVRCLGAKIAAEVLEADSVNAGLKCLLDRGPIQQMNRRQQDGRTGDAGDGNRCYRDLRSADATKRLCALAQTLYVIRCNGAT